MKNKRSKSHGLKFRIILERSFSCQGSFCATIIYLFTILIFLNAAPHLQSHLSHTVWQYRMPGFSQQNYNSAVQGILATFENAANTPLKPGKTQKVALKVYTHSGATLATPRPLVRALIQALETRGFLRENIFIVDKRTRRLREAGFLPPLSFKQTVFFEGAPVYALDDGQSWEPDWFYASPLIAFNTHPRAFLPKNNTKDVIHPDRKSFLPTLLLFDVDFWINLPVPTDHPTFGVNATIANATLWNISNNQRFIPNPYHAALALAEIAAIPELKEAWVFSIVSLEHYQFAAGPLYNARYVKQEPLLWLSTNPLALDYALFEKFNAHRIQHNIPCIDPPLFFNYCAQLSLGSFLPQHLRWRHLP